MFVLSHMITFKIYNQRFLFNTLRGDLKLQHIIGLRRERAQSLKASERWEQVPLNEESEAVN